MCLSADWAGILVLSNSSFLGFCFFWSSSLWLFGRPPFLGYFVPLLRLVLSCVFGSVFLGLASATACSGCPCFGWPFASVLPLWFSFLCAAGLFSLVAAVRCFWRGCLLVFALVSSVVAVWPALSWLCPLPPHPPWLVLWRLLVQSVLCWSLPPGIWLYLQRSGCHTFGMACCG